MAITAKPLFEAKYVENSPTDQYTAPTAGGTIIDKLTAINLGGSIAEITVNIAPSSAGVTTDNILVYQKQLKSLEPYTFPEIVGHVLAQGGVIHTLADTASAIVIRASGREIS